MRSITTTMHFALAAACLLATATGGGAQMLDAAGAVRSPLARTLIARWESENRGCLEQNGAALPCARRQLTARKLKGLGWCYGKLDLVGAVYDWHRCR